MASSTCLALMLRFKEANNASLSALNLMFKSSLAIYSNIILHNMVNNDVM